MNGPFSCPCCGKPADGIALEGLAHVPMAPSARRIVDCLVRAYPRIVDMDTIIVALYAHDPQGGPLTANTIVRVHVSALRKILAPAGWTIPRSGKGNLARYRLERLP